MKHNFCITSSNISTVYTIHDINIKNLKYLSQFLIVHWKVCFNTRQSRQSKHLWSPWKSEIHLFCFLKNSLTIAWTFSTEWPLLRQEAKLFSKALFSCIFLASFLKIPSLVFFPLFRPICCFMEAPPFGSNLNSLEDCILPKFWFESCLTWFSWQSPSGLCRLLAKCRSSLWPTPTLFHRRVSPWQNSFRNK